MYIVNNHQENEVKQLAHEQSESVTKLLCDLHGMRLVAG